MQAKSEKIERAEKRTIIIKVRVNAPEEAHLKEVAAARGRVPAVLLRELGLELTPPERRSAGADSTVRGLARIGVLLRSLEELDRDGESEQAALVTATLKIVNDLIRGL